MKFLTEKAITLWHKYWGRDPILALPHSEKLDRHLMQTLLGLHYLRDIEIKYYDTGQVLKVWSCNSHKLLYYPRDGYFVINNVTYYSRPNHKIVELLRRVKCKKEISKLVQTVVAEAILGPGLGRS